ncbi:hypothetical protein [Rahnella sp. PAMC 25559]|uniref:hypothetical protein n=1 Tax=Rahnella sp. PAMC 25559 TaxID=3423225 RepID=UPI003D6747CB
MIPLKLKSFILKVLNNTEDDSLKWIEADNEAYFCNHKNHTLHISQYFDPDREEGYFKFIIKTSGKITPFSVYDDEDDYILMRKLWSAIIVNANDISDDLENFFD